MVRQYRVLLYLRINFAECALVQNVFPNSRINLKAYVNRPVKLRELLTKIIKSPRLSEFSLFAPCAKKESCYDE